MIAARVVGGRDFFTRLAADTDRLQADIKEAIRELGEKYRSIAISRLQAGKSGKQYGGRTRRLYRVVRRRVELFGGQTGTVRRRVARRPVRTKAYTASAPGQAPAVFTGTLLRSVRLKMPSRGKGFTGVVFANRGVAPHRHLLEFGTGPRNTRKPARYVGFVAPRPLWTPLNAEAQAELHPRVLQALERAGWR